MGAGGREAWFRKKPELPKGRENTLLLEIFLSLFRRSLEQTCLWNLESGTAVRLITVLLSQKISSKNYLPRRRGGKTDIFDGIIIMPEKKVRKDPDKVSLLWRERTHQFIAFAVCDGVDG